jgi:ABC-2 type transport system ATP-binding protein
MPQKFGLYEDLSVQENLDLYADLHGVTAEERRRVYPQLMDMTALGPFAKRLAGRLSGGMKQKLGLACTLVRAPDLLLLDEPTVGVDPQSRNAILESVAELGRSGMAILYTTHYMEEAERLCDRVGIIDLGEIRAEGTRRELVALIGQQDEVRLTATGDLQRASEAAAGVPGVVSAAHRGELIEVLTTDARGVLPALLATVGAAGATIKGVDVVEPDLEAVFLHLTGKALRDAGS